MRLKVAQKAKTEVATKPKTHQIRARSQAVKTRSLKPKKLYAPTQIAYPLREVTGTCNCAEIKALKSPQNSAFSIWIGFIYDVNVKHFII